MTQVEGVFVNGKMITLVGTAHVSRESVKQVNKLVKELKPDVIGVELCKKRYDSIKNPDFNNSKVSTIIKNGDFKLLLFQTILNWYQAKIGKKLNITPGAEMIEAMQTAEKKNIKLELIDRDINITLSRLFSKLTIIDKAKMILSVFDSFGQEITKEQIESLKEESTLDALIKELSKESPVMKKVLIDERDAHIAFKLKNSKGKNILAFIGAGHVKGVKKHLLHSKFEIVESEKEKKKKSILPFILPIALIGVLIAGFFNSPEFGGTMLLYYCIITSIGALIGGIVSLAHPLATLAGTLIAPLSVIHPFITSGMVSALVEYKFRKVRVIDLKKIAEIDGVVSAYKNNLVRILLVFSITNLFTSIAAIIAFPYIISLLF